MYPVSRESVCTYFRGRLLPCVEQADLVRRALLPVQQAQPVELSAGGSRQVKQAPAGKTVYPCSVVPAVWGFGLGQISFLLLC